MTALEIWIRFLDSPEGSGALLCWLPLLGLLVVSFDRWAHLPPEGQ